jgi:hypothetical protein
MSLPRRAVLNECVEARHFCRKIDKEQHITFKELKTERCVITFFLPELKGRRLLLHEGNQSVEGVLARLKSRSPWMISELRKLFLLTDENTIKIRTQYIRSAANILADKLIRETDTSDWQLAWRIFKHLNNTFHEHAIEKIVSKDNTQLPR